MEKELFPPKHVSTEKEERRRRYNRKSHVASSSTTRTASSNGTDGTNVTDDYDVSRSRQSSQERFYSRPKLFAKPELFPPAAQALSTVDRFLFDEGVSIPFVDSGERSPNCFTPTPVKRKLLHLSSSKPGISPRLLGRSLSLD